MDPQHNVLAKCQLRVQFWYSIIHSTLPVTEKKVNYLKWRRVKRTSIPESSGESAEGAAIFETLRAVSKVRDSEVELEVTRKLVRGSSGEIRAECEAGWCDLNGWGAL